MSRLINLGAKRLLSLSPRLDRQAARPVSRAVPAAQEMRHAIPVQPRESTALERWKSRTFRSSLPSWRRPLNGLNAADLTLLYFSVQLAQHTRPGGIRTRSGMFEVVLDCSGQRLVTRRTDVGSTPTLRSLFQFWGSATARSRRRVWKSGVELARTMRPVRQHLSFRPHRASFKPVPSSGTRSLKSRASVKRLVRDVNRLIRISLLHRMAQEVVPSASFAVDVFIEVDSRSRRKKEAAEVGDRTSITARWVGEIDDHGVQWLHRRKPLHPRLGAKVARRANSLGSLAQLRGWHEAGPRVGIRWS